MLSTRFTTHSLVTEAHISTEPYLSDQSTSIDATMGNGHDTLFLAKKSLKVYAFDIQKNAIHATRARLDENNCLARVSLIHAGHETMTQHINPGEKADVIMFNLGYLPHADPAIITQEKNTMTALNQALSLLSDKGIISLLTYPGHQGGDTEMQAIMQWIQQLNSSQLAITFIHSMHEQENSPRLLTLQNISSA